MKSVFLMIAAFTLPAFLGCDISYRTARAEHGIRTEGPIRAASGETLVNKIALVYDAPSPELIHLWMDGKIAKTFSVEGKGKVDIEIADGALLLSGEAVLFRVPLDKDGLLASEVGINENGEMVFDIAVDGDQVMRIECPAHVFGKPKQRPAAEQRNAADSR
jgi:hypothetical protein